MAIKPMAVGALDAKQRGYRMKFRVGEFTPDNVPASNIHRWNADALESIKARSPELFADAIRTKLWRAEEFYYKKFLPWLNADLNRP